MARNINGTTDLITVSDDAAIQNVFSGGGTVSCWINPNNDGEGSGGRIIEKQSSSGYLIFVGSESGSVMKLRLQRFFTGGSRTWATTNRVITEQVWNHVCVEYDDSDVANDPTMFINGSKLTVGSGLDAASSTTGTAVSDAGTDLAIGNNLAASRTFDGEICEVCFLDTMLSDNECIALYSGSNPIKIRKGNSPFYLPIYGNGSPEPDLSGNANNGTLTGTSFANHAPVQSISSIYWSSMYEPAGAPPSGAGFPFQRYYQMQGAAI